MTNKKTIYSLYLGFSVVLATIAGIWAFTANRFQTYECLFIVLAGAVVGLGIGLVVQVTTKLFRK